MCTSNVIDIIKNTITWILLIIILPIPLLFLFTFKMLITLIAKLKYSSDLSTFHISDTMAIGDFFYSKPLLNIGMIIKINGEINIAKLRQLFQTELLDPQKTSTNSNINNNPLHKNLYCYVQRFCGYNFKRSVKSIKIEEHIIEKKLKSDEFNILVGNMNENATRTTTETSEQLSNLINMFFYSPHTFGKPFWEVLLVKDEVEGDLEMDMSPPPTNHCRSLVLFKIHHCFADGYSLIYLFDILTGNKSQNLTVPFNESLWDKVKIIASGPSTLSNFLNASNSFKNPFPVSGKNTCLNYSLVTLDLAKIKTIRKLTCNGKTHVLSILLTLLGGLFRRILIEKGKFKSEEELPEHIYVGSSLAWPDHPRNKMCNEWTVGGFKVPLKNPNPLERLIATEEDHNQFCQNAPHKIVKRLMVPLSYLFPACVGEKMGDMDIEATSSWAAIVCGDDYKLLGNNIEHIFPFVGHTVPKATWITISMSHSGKIDITIGVNKEFKEDVLELSRITSTMLNEELDNMLAACEKQT